MSYVELIKIEDASGEHFKIRNDVRDFRFDISIGGEQVILKASCRPEWSSDFPYALFLQGSESEFDNDTVIIPRKYLKYILLAVYKYNLSQNREDKNSIVSEYKFKCTRCNKNKTVLEYHQEHFQYCIECASELKICAGCNKPSGFYVFGEQYFCESCVVRNGYCHACDTDRKVIRYKQVKIPKNYHGETVDLACCPECWTKEISLEKELHYQHKPSQFLFWDYDYKSKTYTQYNEAPNNVLFMGTEIEAQFEHKRHINVVLNDILKIHIKTNGDTLYAKHDGTVPDPGSEIVTHPMTLAVYRSLVWNRLFDNIITPIHRGIGGHIHINKNAFSSPLHVFKFLNFLRTNVAYVEWIGERPLQESWCKPSSRNGRVVNIAKTFHKNMNVDRYEMVNFTAKTIELRFFWSPRHISALLKNIEFVDALYNFTRDCKLKFSYQDFENFIEDSCIKYPYLYNFIYTRQHQHNNNQVFFVTNSEVTPYHNSPSSPLRTPRRAEVDVAPPVSTLDTCSYCECYVYSDSEYVEESGRFLHYGCVEDRDSILSESDFDEDYCDLDENP